MLLWISIHAAREGGDPRRHHPRLYGAISIHAAREGGDGCIISSSNKGKISIHAAREGGDRMPFNTSLSALHFNPRRP